MIQKVTYKNFDHLLTRCTRGAAINIRRSTVTTMPNLNSMISGSSICAYTRKNVTKTVALPICLSTSL